MEAQLIRFQSAGFHLVNVVGGGFVLGRGDVVERGRHADAGSTRWGQHRRQSAEVVNSGSYLYVVLTFVPIHRC